ncbi:response regulator [Gemmatimonas aurantiaca]|nr:response regulator [Gemmatimonas aurantiaca]
MEINPEKSKKRILVVDDEEIMRDFLVDVLEEYEVTTAEDGDIAISKLECDQYDLVITDLKMPRVSGDMVVKKAIELNPDYKVIVISGYSTLFTVSESIEGGACAFLSKPFSVQQLRDEITKSFQDADRSNESNTSAG